MNDKTKEIIDHPLMDQFVQLIKEASTLECLEPYACKPENLCKACDVKADAIRVNGLIMQAISEVKHTPEAIKKVSEILKKI